jgi:hypothetical protein
MYYSISGIIDQPISTQKVAILPQKNATRSCVFLKVSISICNMNRIFPTLLFLMSSVAHAQLQEYERRLTCGETQFVMSALIKTAQEKPVWGGTDPQTGTQTSILVNAKTLTWTVVQYDHKMACVLQSGEGFRVLTEVLKESQ